MRWKVVLSLALMTVSLFFVSDGNAVEPKVTGMFDKDSGLQYQMEVLTDKDDGVYGLLIGIKNLNKGDVLLRMPAELLEFVMMSIVTDKGKLISIPPKIYTVDGDDRQKFSELVIPKLNVHEWFVPVRDYVKDSESIKNGIRARISVFLMLSYKLVDGEDKATKDFRKANVSLVNNNSLFTSRALEGNPYDKFRERGVIQSIDKGSGSK